MSAHTTLDALTSYITSYENQLTQQRAQLQTYIDQHPENGDITPEQMTDANGRYILGDMLIALANAYTALANLRAVTPV